jgi:S-formylglutathione hydrolase
LNVSHISCIASNSSWCSTAFKHYLGSVENGARYDPLLLLKSYNNVRQRVVIDQGTADKYLLDHLVADKFVEAARDKLQLTYSVHADYDHSYFFVSTFIESHIAFHSKHCTDLK